MYLSLSRSRLVRSGPHCHWGPNEWKGRVPLSIDGQGGADDAEVNNNGDSSGDGDDNGGDGGDNGFLSFVVDAEWITVRDVVLGKGSVDGLRRRRRRSFSFT